MSLTLQLLRMDAEDVWTRHRQRRQQHNAANANANVAVAEAKPEAAVNCAKVVAEAPHSYCKSIEIVKQMGPRLRELTPRIKKAREYDHAT